jgi:uncharacterized repeat protein (TIGR03803 family)
MRPLVVVLAVMLGGPAVARAQSPSVAPLATGLVASPVRIVTTFDVPPHDPVGGLVEGADGSLYGTAAQHGEGSVVFRIPPGGGTATVVARFDRGALPLDAMVAGPDGLLYGTTYGGGVEDRGTVFRVDPAAATITTLHAFTGADGSHPVGRLVVAPDGLIYGTTEGGAGGTIFELDPGTGRTRTRHQFAEFDPLGRQPKGGLVRLPGGLLYGVLFAGGPLGEGGTLYRFDPTTGAVTVVHAFARTDGWRPVSCPLPASDGALYGTTMSGGPENAGAIYRIEPQSGAFETIHHFRPSNHADGSGPFARLVEAPSGDLFGVTLQSSLPDEGGSIFRVMRMPGGWGFVTVGVLNPAIEGRGPVGDLMIAAGGRVHGVTESGGPIGGGTVFRFDGTGTNGQPLALEVVHAFSTRGPSWRPLVPPVPGFGDRLYGVTRAGGAGGLGEVYSILPASGVPETVGLVPVPPPSINDDVLRTSPLVDGGDGSLYGAAANGTGTSGLVFRVSPMTGTVAPAAPLPLHGLGSSFVSRLVRAGNGLFGLVSTLDHLTLYRFDPIANTVTTAVTITPIDPMRTGQAGLVARSDGRIVVMLPTFVPEDGTTITSVFDVFAAAGTARPLPVAATLAPVLPVPMPDGSLMAVAAEPVGRRRVVRVTISGDVVAGCLPPDDGRIASVDVAPDGGVFVVVSGPTTGAALYRCTADAPGATLLHRWPRGDAVSSLALHAGVFYGATTGGPTGGGTVFAFNATNGAPPVVDPDGDGLDSNWEAAMGLDSRSLAGDDGAGGDPDGDGVSNAAEYAAGTHPRGVFTRYFAEGSTNAFFRTELAVANAGAGPARVLLRFLTDDRRAVALPLVVAAASRSTIDVGAIDGLAVATFSIVVESDVAVAVERTMTWDARAYGSHTETAIAAPSTSWYFAEGSTSGDFALFYLLQNPDPAPVVATVRYLRPFGLPPIVRQYVLPAASRTTIPVDAVDPLLESTDVAAEITAARPIAAERAMYLSRPGQPFAAGHDSAGVTAPALEWLFAEGATGPFFDLFLLVANPAPQPAAIEVDYLLAGGAVLTKAYAVRAESRLTIWVDDERIPAGSEARPLANVAVAARIRAVGGVPIVAERTMWWPGPETTAAFWYETHNSPGATTVAGRWIVAGGEVGGADDSQTYVLIANTGASAGRVLVRLLFEDGNSTGRYYDLPPTSRTNVPVGDDLPEAAGHQRFSVVVATVGGSPLPLVVDRATYASPGGVVWARGSSALATPGVLPE